MYQGFLTGKFVWMTLTTMFLLTISLPSVAALSLERHHALRFLFSDHKTTTFSTTTDEPSFGQGIGNWLSGFLSGDSNKEKPNDSFSKLALLKKFLSSSSSSSSSDKSSKLDKLFQILGNSAADDKNQSSSSSNKLNTILGFFNNQGSSSSSSNLQLAMKLLSLSQGNGGLSSFSGSDMASLLKFASG